MIDFDESVLNPDDLNVYVPESTVRGVVGIPGAFGETQRMAYWRQDGQKIMIDVIAPQGLLPKYLKLYIVHPPDVSVSPDFILTSAVIYDIDGNITSVSSDLNYYP